MAFAATLARFMIAFGRTNKDSAIAKEPRDEAESGSALAPTMLSNQSTKAWTMPLEVMALSTFLLGFCFASANILHHVRLSSNTMATVLSEMKAHNDHKQDGDNHHFTKGETWHLYPEVIPKTSN